MALSTCTHWGCFVAETSDGRITELRPVERDSDPSPIGRSLLASQDPGCRVHRPSIRRGYLTSRHHGERSQRGVEPFVAVPWDEALDIAAEAIRNVIDEHGNEAIFAGSYGWSSAGAFHGAQAQLQRFLNCCGGFTRSIQSYSTGTAQIIIPHVLGVPALKLMMESPSMEDVAANAKLIVSFGGISMKNMQINQGGITDHSASDQLRALRAAGVDVVCVSPTRDDVADFLQADWWPIRPNADLALMLALANVLHTEALHDEAFLNSHCVGYEQFVPYLTGELDGVAKTPQWAATLCDIDPERIRALARRMANEPCLLSISWSLQRTEHGDQPYWMLAVLGAMLGNIGAPGQGIAYGYGCIHNFGFANRRGMPFRVGELPRGKNAISTFIPVARIADLLLHPGESYPFDGQTFTYPDIKLVYWSGGNPFHHHQDLNRLREAWTRPQTVIVNETVWTSTARHADIVFPATTPLEREDFAWGRAETCAAAMHRILDPYAQAKDDFTIFSELAQRLGCAEPYTEGRSARQWIEHLWQITRDNAAAAGVELPEFATFWEEGFCRLDASQLVDRNLTLEMFRADPQANSLPTPSGKIEIFSERLASFDLADCGGYPAWRDKHEFIGSERSRRYPLALNSNQPSTRLHSQYDFAGISRDAKIRGREPVRINPVDAGARGIAEGDIVRLYNDRGATLAAAVITDRVRAGVVVLSTGAWYDPQDPSKPASLDVHGNPNVLTRDVGTSSLAQGTSAHSTLIEMERFDEPLPEIKVFDQPTMAAIDV